MSKKHILIPLDLLRGSAKALVFVQQMALENPLTITLLHVIDLNIGCTISGVDAQLFGESQVALAKLAKLFFGSEQATRIAVRFGQPVAEIVAEAQAEAVDMIVLCGPKSKPGMRLFHRGISVDLVRHAPCPTLVLPPAGNGAPLRYPQPSEESIAFSKAVVRAAAA